MSTELRVKNEWPVILLPVHACCYVHLLNETEDTHNLRY